MKHVGEFSLINALPDAPMAMPKQQLERPRSLFRVIRDALAAFVGR